MGRYLTGSAGFSHKYRFGEQASNLIELAGAAGVGRSVMKVSFRAHEPYAPTDAGELDDADAWQDPPAIDVMHLAHDLIASIGAEGSVVEYLYHDGESALEFAQYAMGQEIIEVIARLDASLPQPVRGFSLIAQARYTIERDDFDRLLAYANAPLPDAIRLQRTDVGDEDKVDAAFVGLLGVDGYLPHLALSIASHAIHHDLETMVVEELDPWGGASEFWVDLCGSGWASQRFESPDEDDADAQFARGLVAVFADEVDDAVAHLQRAHRCGDPRAARWLRVLEHDVADLPPEQQRPIARRRDADGDVRLQRVLLEAKARGERYQRLAALEQQLGAYYDRFAARSMTPAETAEVLDLVETLAREQAAHITARWLDRAVFAAINTRDLAVIERAAALGESLFPQLEMGEGGEALLGRLAYNVACAFARLRRNDDAVRWLGKAAQLGDDITTAADDSDFEGLWSAPTFRALMARCGGPDER